VVFLFLQEKGLKKGAPGRALFLIIFFSALRFQKYGNQYQKPNRGGDFCTPSKSAGRNN
jgi:hypothetical protein